VECVREANQGSRRPRTALGGRLAAGAAVTKTLIAVNVLLFLVELAYPNLGNDWGMLGYASFGGPMQGVAAGQWYRLLTSAFLPPATGLSGLGLMDILFNMWALYAVGPALEQLLGRSRFIAIYLLSALGGSVMYFLIGPHNVLALGASGAIFGLFGALFIVTRKLRLNMGGVVTIIVINLVFSFIYRSSIAWQDHVGGLIVGVVMTFAIVYAPRSKNRTAVQVAAGVAVFVVLVVLVILRSHNLTSQLAY
jgi:membrane associated rhomboid family serine protease